jgi:hypothetical protein
MDQKKKSDPPRQEEPGGFRKGPLLEEPVNWEKRIENASSLDEKISIIREGAAAGNKGIIPALLAIYAEFSDEELATEARNAIIGFGMIALDELGKLEAGGGERIKICARELAADVAYSYYKARAENGDLSVTGEIVDLFSDLSTGYELAEKVRSVVTEEMGVSALPELIRIADEAPDPHLQDCAIVFISDIAANNSGCPELLDAVPMLGRKIRALEEVEVGREVIERIRKGGPNESAAQSLLILRTIHPGLSVVSNALELLQELWNQFPGDERILERAFVILGKIGTKDPVLNDLIHRTIREICGFEPPLLKTDKSEN